MTSESRGYSYRTVKLVQNLPPDSLIRRLADACIARDVPVTAIAHGVGVNKVSVYAWFTGAVLPRKSLVPVIERFILEVEKG